MSPCQCLPADLTAVTFTHGTVLLRCSRHEQQSWLVDGQPVDRTDALSRLRTLFAQHRGQRPAASAVASPGRTRIVDLAQPRRAASTTDDVAAGLVGDPRDDERLTALLNARGLQGSWAVA